MDGLDGQGGEMELDRDMDIEPWVLYEQVGVYPLGYLAYLVDLPTVDT